MAKIIHISHSMKSTSNIAFRLKYHLRSMFYRPLKDFKKIPVIINNFNRLDYLQQQISWLESCGLNNIYIIDNASSYPPLLSYYKTLRYPVFFLNKNVGYRALFDTHIYQYFKNDYYVYTDPDIIAIKECPANFIDYFVDVLQRYPEIGKIGFGLKIDDLPEYYQLRDQVKEYEAKYWLNKINDEVYDALVDTTFALYRPGAKGDWQLKAYRSDYPYLAHHLPWYENSENPGAEEKYYISESNKNSLWYSNLKLTTGMKNL